MLFVTYVFIFAASAVADMTTSLRSPFLFSAARFVMPMRTSVLMDRSWTSSMITTAVNIVVVDVGKKKKPTTEKKEKVHPPPTREKRMYALF